MMARHAVLLAAFFVQSDRPPGAARPKALDLHLQGRVDAREAIGECGDQRAIPKTAERHIRDRFEKLAPLAALEHAQEMAAHWSPRTTKLYDRTKERLTQEVERIRL